MHMTLAIFPSVNFTGVSGAAKRQQDDWQASFHLAFLEMRDARTLTISVSRVNIIASKCQSKVVMSPLSKVEMSPFNYQS
jgi:hypothetical protein